MFLKLFLAFTLIPVFEIYLLIEAGDKIGSLSTIGLVILSGIIGAWLARLQGLTTMKKIQASLNNGIMPKEEIIDGLIIFIAGVVLLTPGFLTDIAGLLLLFPPSREILKKSLKSRFDSIIINKTIDI
ncbi:MAG: FxsA family protein [Desulfobacterales bacterium]|nr:FxsA family protein [Desulfobacterales bacterium]